MLEGDDVENAEIRYEQVSEEDFDSWADLTVGSDYFSCPTCHLVLDSYEMIDKAGLPENFAATTDDTSYWDDESEYGND